VGQITNVNSRCDPDVYILAGCFYYEVLRHWRVTEYHRSMDDEVSESSRRSTP